MADSGVFPCYEGQFSVGESNLPIADMETFSISIDNGIEEWTPYGEDGWRRALLTAKAVTISVAGKRNVGDAGNDLIASKAFKNGRDAEEDFTINFKDGMKVTFPNSIISVTAFEFGDSTNVAPLEFDVTSNGKPTIIPKSEG